MLCFGPKKRSNWFRTNTGINKRTGQGRVSIDVLLLCPGLFSSSWEKLFEMGDVLMPEEPSSSPLTAARHR